MSEPYSDNYETCAQTYSTLRIFSNEGCPDYVSKLLQLTPTESFHLGELYGQNQLNRKWNGWFYSTRTLVVSQDTRRHIDFLLDAIEPRATAFDELSKLGYEFDIVSFWQSSTGHGGPALTHLQMKRLAERRIDVWWDVYY